MKRSRFKITTVLIILTIITGLVIFSHSLEETAGDNQATHNPAPASGN